MEINKKHLIFFALVFICLAGCTSKYFIDRGRDAADIMSVSIGRGYGFKARASLVSAGMLYDRPYMGLRGGRLFYTPIVFDRNQGEYRSDSEDFLFGFTGEERFAAGGSSLRRKEIKTRLNFKGFQGEAAMVNIIFIIPPFCVVHFFPRPQKPISISPYYFSEAELTAGLYYSLRLGFNAGEALDFIAGIFGADIMKDDVGIIEIDLDENKDGVKVDALIPDESYKKMNNLKSFCTRPIVLNPSENNDMIFVKGGSYEMGGKTSDARSMYVKDDLPAHQVKISDFNLGKYEVTQKEWKQYMPSESYDKGYGDNYPVYNVSWYEIVVYCNKRSIAEGLNPCYTVQGETNPSKWGNIPIEQDSTWNKIECNWSANGYRLTTEAEWEYAARGGIHHTDDYRYSGSNDINEVAWYQGNRNDESSTKMPNKLGMFNMSGNVSEWCWDWYNEDYYRDSKKTGIVNDPKGPESGYEKLIPAWRRYHRVLRGGSWNSEASHCRISYRYHHTPDHEYNQLGFRVARSK